MIIRKFLLIFIAVAAIGAGVYFAIDNFKSKPSTTTTTVAVVKNAPLSGLPDPSGTAFTRPALTIKIENTPEARPLWGVDQADVVYEEIVNGGITRLAAIFNTFAPTKVGPVRSVRPTDASVVWPIGGIFAYSGGAQYAVDAISLAPVKLIDESNAGAAMFRDPHRVPPHNLYAVASSLFAFNGTPTPPPALFTYLTPKDKIVGNSVSSFSVNFPSIYPVTWTWDTKTKSWDRSIFGSPDITGTGVRLSPKNVVVMWINYQGGVGTMNSVGDLYGTGQAEVFQDGKEIVGTWSRSSKTSPAVYKTLKGKIIRMLPGQTWVELPVVGEAVNVTK